MIVNGLVGDGQSIQLTVSLQEFKDFFILFDVLTNATNKNMNADLTDEVIHLVTQDVYDDGMVTHNEAEIYSLLHACSVLMQPLADNIISKNKAAEERVMKEAGNGVVQ